MELKIDSLSTIHQTAKKFLEHCTKINIIAFYGEMGSGKTTFIKAICRELGIIDQVSSPTFALVNEYKRQDANSVFHFDFYRIETLEEVYDLGYEDYFYSGKLCLIEWPEMVEDLLPENTLKVYISENPDQSRLLKF